MSAETNPYELVSQYEKAKKIAAYLKQEYWTPESRDLLRFLAAPENRQEITDGIREKIKREAGLATRPSHAVWILTLHMLHQEFTQAGVPA